MKLSELVRRASKRIVLPLALFALCASTALATWSIVVVNTKTGEVCVACATCLSGTITQYVPLIKTDYGVAACQSSIDYGAKNRKKIWAGFQSGMTPREILDVIAQTDAGYQSRQIGIVTLGDVPVTFTGSQDGTACGGVTGISGDLRYAIQGNVLTCSQVWLDAEYTLINTPGDLSQKVMAAMQAARLEGGDGRCSCNPTAPDSCGCVTGGLVNSARTGFFILARIGDVDGVCDGPHGCANGAYYLSLNIPGTGTGLDPVVQLQAGYDAWRASLVGVPDQVNSLVQVGAQSLVADGKSTTWVDFKLFDVDHNPVNHGGYSVQTLSVSGGTPVTTPINFVDHNDGTYSFELQAGLQTGTDRWRLVLTDPNTFAQITLQPDITIRVDPFSDLHCGYDQVSNAGGAPVPFTINLGAGEAGSSYILLGSASGTTPGIPFGGSVLPLNLDKFFRRTISAANTAAFPNSAGTLDVDGRATPRFVAMPGTLVYFVGHHLDFAVAVLAPSSAVSSAVGFDVFP